MQTIDKPVLGWREWVALPDLALSKVKAKIDTGARSSALHAFEIDPYRKGGRHWVMFMVHSLQKRTDIAVECHAEVKDRRVVADSGGHKQRRYVIETRIVLGRSLITAEMTLTNRDTMRFRMLLGRTAMASRFLVDPGASYLCGMPDSDQCRHVPERNEFYPMNDTEQHEQEE